MKVLYFTKYTRLGASSRMRSFQYFPLLESKGCAVTVAPLFNDQYLLQLYSKETPGSFNIIKCYLRRFFKLTSVFRYDIVFIEKELFPYFPAWFEMLFRLLRVKYVVDYDDAIFHNYDSSNNPVIKFLLSNKIDLVMKYSSGVIAGNEYLKARAIKAGSTNVILIPTVIDIERYKPVEKKGDDGLVIGWVGSPSTLKYLLALKSVFKDLSLIYNFKLHIIGGNGSIGLPELEKQIDWAEATEVEEIARFDVGIMPLTNSKWEQGKCAYKLIQYMACAIPSVGSPVGANFSVIEDGVNGYLPNSDGDWYTKLSDLLGNKQKRIEIGQRGYVTVRDNYTIQAVFEKQYQFLKVLA